MAENMSLGDKLKEGIAFLSTPECKESFSKLSFDSVKTNTMVCVKKYLCYTGTAGREEFWQFYLALVVICIIPCIGQLIGVLLLPAWFCALARRIRETGENPWMAIVPFVGIILALRGAAQPCECGCGCEQK